MSTSYMGKLARINLSTGEIKVEQLDLDLAKKFIGGRGLGTKMLYDEGIATVDPRLRANTVRPYKQRRRGSPLYTRGP